MQQISFFFAALSVWLFVKPLKSIKAWPSNGSLSSPLPSFSAADSKGVTATTPNDLFEPEVVKCSNYKTAENLSPLYIESLFPFLGVGLNACEVIEKTCAEIL